MIITVLTIHQFVSNAISLTILLHIVPINQLNIILAFEFPLLIPNGIQPDQEQTIMPAILPLQLMKCCHIVTVNMSL